MSASIAAGDRQFFRGQRQLEGSRHVDDVHVFAGRARALERIDRGRKQTLGNKTIKPADDDTEAQTGSAEFTTDFARF